MLCMSMGSAFRQCGCSSVVEHLLAKERVESSNLFIRLFLSSLYHFSLSLYFSLFLSIPSFFIFLYYHLYLFLLLILFGFFPISYRYSCLSLRYLETLLSRLLVLIAIFHITIFFHQSVSSHLTVCNTVLLRFA